MFSASFDIKAPEINQQHKSHHDEWMTAAEIFTLEGKNRHSLMKLNCDRFKKWNQNIQTKKFQKKNITLREKLFYWNKNIILQKEKISLLMSTVLWLLHFSQKKERKEN